MRRWLAFALLGMLALTAASATGQTGDPHKKIIVTALPDGFVGVSAGGLHATSCEAVLQAIDDYAKANNIEIIDYSRIVPEGRSWTTSGRTDRAGACYSRTVTIGTRGVPDTFALARGRPLPKASTPPPAPTRTDCSAAALAGSWTNNGKDYSGLGVSLTVDGRGQGTFAARQKPNNTWPYPMLKTIVIGSPSTDATALPAGQCLFKSRCMDGGGGTSTCYAQFDSVANTLRFGWMQTTSGAADVREKGVWTRGTPAPVAAAKVCKRADIEGAWYRTDGSALRISATNLDSGGVGLFFIHPQGWPRGVLKYSRIRQDGDSCTFQAVCVEIERENGTADYRVLEPACTLTLDPLQGVLTQGGRWTYGRTESNSAEAQARRRDEAVQSALSSGAKAPTAETDRLQREYEAKKKADEAAYARAQAEYERKKAEIEAQRQRELREWEARVAACRAGDKSQC